MASLFPRFRREGDKYRSGSGFEAGPFDISYPAASARISGSLCQQELLSIVQLYRAPGGGRTCGIAVCQRLRWDAAVVEIVDAGGGGGGEYDAASCASDFGEGYRATDCLDLRCADLAR
jgi:hypothetical protein